ncbi:MAG: hypothetical protein JWN78_2667 [Bacteroidota bacterium]|nr:hypothetical protein [Bacteroidota bacterium]
MKKILILFLPVVLFLSSCTKEDSTTSTAKTCGQTSNWTDDLSDNYSFEELNGSVRSLFYENTSTPTNICSYNVAQATFTVTPINNGTLTGVTSIQGKAYWGQNEKKFITLTYNSSSNLYSGTLSGLDFRNAFGDDPGWVGISIIFNMPTTGTSTGDRNIVDAQVDRMSVSFTYNQVK